MKTIKQALQAILDEYKPEYKGYGWQARGYAERLLGLLTSGSTDRQEMKWQMIGVLSNLQHWQGARARAVKKVLRKG